MHNAFAQSADLGKGVFLCPRFCLTIIDILSPGKGMLVFWKRGFEGFGKEDASAVKKSMQVLWKRGCECCGKENASAKELVGWAILGRKHLLFTINV